MLSDPSKRTIADTIRNGAFASLVSFADGARETTNVQYLAKMLWDAAVEGMATFADGSFIDLREDPRLWLDLIKFLANHLDGAASLTANFNGVNVFKVYQGIDTDRL